MTAAQRHTSTKRTKSDNLLRRLLLLCTLIGSIGAAWGIEVTETYDFGSFITANGAPDMTHGSTIVATQQGTSEYKGGNLYQLDNPTNNGNTLNLQNRFAIDYGPKDSNKIRFMWRSSANSHQHGLAGQWNDKGTENNAAHLSILNLKVGDKITITWAVQSGKDAQPYLCETGMVTGRNADQYLESGTEYTIAKNGNLDLYFKNNNFAISKIVIKTEGVETVSNPSLSITGASGISRTIAIADGVSSAGVSVSTYYTTDGTTPTSASTKYTAPFSVSSNCTVKAISISNEGTPSDVVSLEVSAGTTLTLNAPTWSKTAYDSATGKTTVRLSSDQSSIIGNPTATIHWSTGSGSGEVSNGSDIIVNDQETLELYAMATGYGNSPTTSVTAIPYNGINLWTETYNGIVASDKGVKIDTESIVGVYSGKDQYKIYYEDDGKIYISEHIVTNSGAGSNYLFRPNGLYGGTGAQYVIFGLKKGEQLVLKGIYGNANFEISDTENLTPDVWNSSTYSTYAYTVATDGDVRFTITRYGYLQSISLNSKLRFTSPSVDAYIEDLSYVQSVSNTTGGDVAFTVNESGFVRLDDGTGYMIKTTDSPLTVTASATDAQMSITFTDSYTLNIKTRNSLDPASWVTGNKMTVGGAVGLLASNSATLEGRGTVTIGKEGESQVVRQVDGTYVLTGIDATGHTAVSLDGGIPTGGTFYKIENTAGQAMHLLVGAKNLNADDTKVVNAEGTAVSFELADDVLTVKNMAAGAVLYLYNAPDAEPLLLNTVTMNQPISIAATEGTLDMSVATTMPTPEVVGQGTITYSSSNKGVAEVESDGTITAKGDGTVTITATDETGAKVTFTLTVINSPKATGIMDTDSEGGVSTFTVVESGNLLQNYSSSLITLGLGAEGETQRAGTVQGKTAIWCVDTNGSTFAFNPADNEAPTMGTFYKFTPTADGYLTVNMLLVDVVNSIKLYCTDGTSQKIEAGAITADKWFDHRFTLQGGKTYYLFAETGLNKSASARRRAPGADTGAYPTLYISGFSFAKTITKTETILISDLLYKSGIDATGGKLDRKIPGWRISVPAAEVNVTKTDGSGNLQLVSGGSDGTYSGKRGEIDLRPDVPSEQQDNIIITSIKIKATQNSGHNLNINGETKNTNDTGVVDAQGYITVTLTDDPKFDSYRHYIRLRCATSQKDYYSTISEITFTYTYTADTKFNEAKGVVKIGDYADAKKQIAVGADDTPTLPGFATPEDDDAAYADPAGFSGTLTTTTEDSSVATWDGTKVTKVSDGETYLVTSFADTKYFTANGQTARQLLYTDATKSSATIEIAKLLYTPGTETRAEEDGRMDRTIPRFTLTMRGKDALKYGEDKKLVMRKYTQSYGDEVNYGTIHIEPRCGEGKIHFTKVVMHVTGATNGTDQFTVNGVSSGNMATANADYTVELTGENQKGTLDIVYSTESTDPETSGFEITTITLYYETTDASDVHGLLDESKVAPTLTLTAPNVTTTVGGTPDIPAAYSSPSCFNGSLTATGHNPAIATFADGKVTATGIGHTTATLQFAETDYFAASNSVTLYVAVEGNDDTILPSKVWDFTDLSETDFTDVDNNYWETKSANDASGTSRSNYSYKKTSSDGAEFLVNADTKLGVAEKLLYVSTDSKINETNRYVYARLKSETPAADGALVFRTEQLKVPIDNMNYTLAIRSGRGESHGNGTVTVGNATGIVGATTDIHEYKLAPTAKGYVHFTFSDDATSVYWIKLIDERISTTATLNYPSDAMTSGSTLDKTSLTVTDENGKAVATSNFWVKYYAMSDNITVDENTGQVTYVQNGANKAKVMAVLTAKDGSGYRSTTAMAEVALQVTVSDTYSFDVLENQVVEITVESEGGATFTLTNVMDGDGNGITEKTLAKGETLIAYAKTAGQATLTRPDATDDVVLTTRAYYYQVVPTLSYPRHNPNYPITTGFANLPIGSPTVTLHEKENPTIDVLSHYEVTYQSSSTDKLVVVSSTGAATGGTASGRAEVTATFTTTYRGYEPKVTVSCPIDVLSFPQTWDFATNGAPYSGMGEGWGSGSSEGTFQTSSFADFTPILTADNTIYPYTEGVLLKGGLRYFTTGNTTAQGIRLGLTQGGPSIMVPVKAGMEVEVVAASGSADIENIIDNVVDLEGEKATLYIQGKSKLTFETHYYIATADGVVTIHSADKTGLYIKSITLRRPELHFHEETVVVNKGTSTFTNPLINAREDANLEFTIKERDPSGLVTAIDPKTGRLTIKEQAPSGPVTAIDEKTGRLTIATSKEGNATIHVENLSPSSELDPKEGDYTLHVVDLEFDKNYYECELDADNMATFNERPLNLTQIPEGVNINYTYTIPEDSKIEATITTSVGTTADLTTYELYLFGKGRIILTAEASQAKATCEIHVNGYTFEDVAPVITTDETEFYKLPFKDSEGDLTGITWTLETIAGEATCSIDDDGKLTNFSGPGAFRVTAKGKDSEDVEHIARYVLTVAYPASSGKEWDFKSLLARKVIVGDKPLPNCGGKALSAFTDDEKKATVILTHSGIETTTQWKMDQKRPSDGSDNRWFYSGAVMGNNAFIAAPTAGLQIKAAPGGFYARDDDDSWRQIGLHRNASIIIPKLKKGDFVVLNVKRVTPSNGAQLTATNVKDLRGRLVNTKFSVTGSQSVTSYPGEYTFQVVEDGDVEFRLEDSGYMDVLKVAIYDGGTYQTTMESIKLDDTKHTDAPATKLIDSEASDPIDPITYTLCNYMNSTNAGPAKYVLKGMNPGEENLNPEDCEYYVDAKTQALIDAQRAHLDFDFEPFSEERGNNGMIYDMARVTVKGGYGRLQFRMNNYTAEGKYLIGYTPDYSLTVGHKPHQDYPFTWNFENISGGAVKNKSNNAYNSISTDYFTWTGLGNETYQLDTRTSGGSLYVPGATLVSASRDLGAKGSISDLNSASLGCDEFNGLGFAGQFAFKVAQQGNNSDDASTDTWDPDTPNDELLHYAMNYAEQATEKKEDVLDEGGIKTGTKTVVTWEAAIAEGKNAGYWKAEDGLIKFGSPGKREKSGIAGNGAAYKMDGGNSKNLLLHPQRPLQEGDEITLKGYSTASVLESGFSFYAEANDANYDDLLTLNWPSNITTEQTLTHKVQQGDGLAGRSEVYLFRAGKEKTVYLTEVTITGPDSEAPATYKRRLTCNGDVTVTIPDLKTGHYVYIKASAAPKTLPANLTAAIAEDGLDAIPYDGTKKVGVWKYRVTADGPADVVFADDTKIYRIGVTNIMKPLKTVGDHAWATESRNHAIDYTQTGAFTLNDVKAHTVTATQYALQRVTVKLNDVDANIPVGDTPPAMPAESGMVLKLDNKANLDKTKAYDSEKGTGQVPLFYPPHSTPILSYADVGFGGTQENLMMANLDERLLTQERETGIIDKNGDNVDDSGKKDGTYTRFIFADRYMKWTKVTSEDNILTYEPFEDSAQPVFYRMHIYKDETYTDGMTYDQLNTLGANKAYMLIRSGNVPDALWKEEESTDPAARRYIGIEGFSDMVEDEDGPDSRRTDDKTYTVGGQAVNGNGPLPRGIYIRNGKKIVVK